MGNSDFRVLVALRAIAFSALYVVSDVMEGYFEERQREEARHGGILSIDELISVGEKYGMHLVDR